MQAHSSKLSGSATPPAGNVAAGGTREDTNQRRLRLREQMKAFYGTAATTSQRRPSNPEGPSASPLPDNSTSGAQASRVPANSVPPTMDMDSEYFNVQHYTTHLLQNETLKGLVERDTQLLRSVRHLDRDLQELVYRNYAKFISASDTIREMRRHVTEMDVRLSALDANMEKVCHTSEQVFTALEPHRSKVEETITTARKLKKAAFIRQLPSTLRDLLNTRDFVQCVQYWVMGDSFFQKHCTEDPAAHHTASTATHSQVMASLTALRRECWSVVQDLYAHMEDAIAQISLDDPTAMDTTHKLVEHLRLLRATSAFAKADVSTPSKTLTPQLRRAGMDDVSFEESIRRVLMRSVEANFSKEIGAVHLALQEALFIPPNAARELRRRWKSSATHPKKSTHTTVADEEVRDDVDQKKSKRLHTSNQEDLDALGTLLLPALAQRLLALPLAQRHLPLEQLNLSEPLAHLKGVCALLAANSHRIHELLMLGQGGGPNTTSQQEEDVAAHIAEHVQPALIELLSPVKAYFSSWVRTYLYVLFSEPRTSPLTQNQTDGSTLPSDQAREGGAASAWTSESNSDALCPSPAEQERTLLHLMHYPHRVGPMLQHLCVGLIRQLRHVAATLRDLGNTYLNTPLRRFQSGGYAQMIDSTVSDVLTAFSKVVMHEKLLEQPVTVTTPTATTATESSSRDPSTALKKELEQEAQHSNPMGVSVTSLLLMAPPPPEGEEEVEETPLSVAAAVARGDGNTPLLSAASSWHFVLSRFAHASFLSCLRQQLAQTIPSNATGSHQGGSPQNSGVALHDSATNPSPAVAPLVDVNVLGSVLAELDRSIVLLLHRAVLVEGQYSLKRLSHALASRCGGMSTYASSAALSPPPSQRTGSMDYFMGVSVMRRTERLSATPGGAEGEEESVGRPDTSMSEDVVQLHPAFISIVMVEWTYLVRFLSALPPIVFATAVESSFSPLHFPHAPLNTHSSAGSLVSGTGRGASQQRHPAGNGAGLAVPATHLNATSLGSRPRGGGDSNSRGGHRSHLVVAYQRRELVSLQHHIDAIFSQQSSRLETRPMSGDPPVVLRCVLAYVLRGLVDVARGMTISHTPDAVVSFPSWQLHCTFLLHALLEGSPTPSKATLASIHGVVEELIALAQAPQQSLTGTRAVTGTTDSGPGTAPAETENETDRNSGDAVSNPHRPARPPTPHARVRAMNPLLYDYPNPSSWWWSAAHPTTSSTAGAGRGLPVGSVAGGASSSHSGSIARGGGAGGEESAKALQREVDEMCTCAYERATSTKATPLGGSEGLESGGEGFTPDRKRPEGGSSTGLVAHAVILPLSQQHLERLLKEGIEPYFEEVGRQLQQQLARWVAPPPDTSAGGNTL